MAHRKVTVNFTGPGGSISPVEYTLDEKNRVVARRTADAPAPGSVESWSQKTGVKVETRPDGSKALSGKPTKEALDVMAFFDMARPCPFPGCESLRRSYQEEMASPGCCKGSVYRKYFDLAWARMRSK